MTKLSVVAAQVEECLAELSPESQDEVERWVAMSRQANALTERP